MSTEPIERRSKMPLWTPAEYAIWFAIRAVESAGDDPLLTGAAALLAQAKEKVADFVDSKIAHLSNGRPTVPFCGHLIDLTTGRCLRCLERTERLIEHGRLDCSHSEEAWDD